MVQFHQGLFDMQCEALSFCVCEKLLLFFTSSFCKSDIIGNMLPLLCYLYSMGFQVLVSFSHVLVGCDLFHMPSICLLLCARRFSIHYTHEAVASTKCWVLVVVVLLLCWPQPVLIFELLSWVPSSSLCSVHVLLENSVQLLVLLAWLVHSPLC